jgi:hypothetical protein
MNNTYGLTDEEQKRSVKDTNIAVLELEDLHRQRLPCYWTRF